MMTDTREGCLFMCWQCAVLWQGLCLASPPGHKGVRIAQHCTMGVPLQKVFAPFQGGGILRAHYGSGFYFLQLLFSVLNNPLFPHTIQALKNPVSPLTLYLLHSYCIFLQRLAWAGLALCAGNMQRCGRGDATSRRSPLSPPP